MRLEVLRAGGKDGRVQFGIGCTVPFECARGDVEVDRDVIVGPSDLGHADDLGEGFGCALELRHAPSLL
jgi:hypothetical protein